MLRTLLLFLALLCAPALAFAQNERKLVEKAQKNFDAGKYDKAIPLLTKLIHNHPNEDNYYYIRAISYRNIGQYQNALNDLNMAVKLKDYDVGYRISRGYLLNAMSMHEKALKDLNEALDLYPKKEQWNTIHLGRAKAYEMLGDSTASAGCYKTMLARDTNCVEALNMWAILWSETKWDTAMLMLDHAYRVDTSSSLTKHNIVYVCRFTGDFKRAVEISTDYMINQDDHKAFALNNRGFAKMKLGDLEGAEKDMLASRKIDPNNSYVYYNLGLLYIEKKNKTQACAYFRQALSMGFTKMYGPQAQKSFDELCQ